MGTTPNFGLPFPAYTDIPDGVAQMQALATATDVAILGTIPTSHALTHNTGIAITVATGWSSAALDFYWEIVRGVFSISVNSTRSGAALTASAAGGLANTLVFTLPAPYRPRIIRWGTFTSDTSHGGAHLATDGQVFITDAHSTSTIATSDTVHITFSFPL